MFHRLLIPLGFFALLSLTAVAADGVKITEQPDKLRIEINGELFTEYCFKGAPHVYFYPLLGPGGAPMTRNWPMKEVAGEEKDHPHHRSLWYSHGAVNGVDFWSETPKAGKIVHDKFLEVKSGANSGVIRSATNWIAPDGSVTMTDERTRNSRLESIAQNWLGQDSTAAKNWLARSTLPVETKERLLRSANSLE